MSKANVQSVEEFDMEGPDAEKSVAQIDPADLPKGKAKAKKAKAAKEPSEPKEPAAPKIPQVGDYGKRGLTTRPFTVTLPLDQWSNNENILKHHQRQVIHQALALLQNDGTDLFAPLGENRPEDALNMGQVITTIEGSEDLLKQMNTNQSVTRCVTYHLSELRKLEAVDFEVAERKPKAVETKGEKAEAVETEGEKAEDQEAA